MPRRRSSPALFELLQQQGDAVDDSPSSPPGSVAPSSMDADGQRPAAAPQDDAKVPSSGGASAASPPDGAEAGSNPDEARAPGGPPEPQPEPQPERLAERGAPRLPEADALPLDDPGFAEPVGPETGVPSVASGGTRMVPVNLMTLAYVVTGALALALISFTIGFRQGQSDAEGTFVVPREVDPEIPEDPILLDPATSPEPEPPRRSEAEVAGGLGEGGGGVVAVAPDVERRTPGLNYVSLGVIGDRPEAERLVRFLEANDIPAQINRIQTRRVRGWQVMTLRGITGREFSQKLPRRTDHEAEIAALGRIWRDQAEGTLDFTSPERWLWVKYDP